MFREIIFTTKKKVLLDLPDEYINHKIQILAFPLDKEVPEKKLNSKASLKLLEDLFVLSEGLKISKKINIDKLLDEVNQ